MTVCGYSTGITSVLLLLVITLSHKTIQTEALNPSVKIIDFDANSISQPVSLSTNTLFSDEQPQKPILSSATSSGYTGLRVFGAFADSSDEGQWSATNQVSGGLQIQWDANKGTVGDASSGLFLFSKNDFGGGMSVTDNTVVMDETTKVHTLMTPHPPSANGALSSSSISFVFRDSLGFHISSPILCDSFEAGYPFTFFPKSLQYHDYNPMMNSHDEAGVASEVGVPSFEGIDYVGFRIDARRGVDTFKSAEVGVKVFTVHALPPMTEKEGIVKEERAGISLEAEQLIEGFGATVAFGVDGLLKNKNVDELSQLLFKDLDLDILRIRNYYQEDENVSFVSQIEDTVSVIELAEKARDNKRPDILLTAWTAPSELKSNSSPLGGTIAYDPNNIMDYHYQDYGKWWTKSLVYYQGVGVYPEYLSIQTQPNKDDLTCPSMKLEPYQQKENGIAGYNMAIEAAIQSMKLSEEINDIPKFVGPETTGFDNDNTAAAAAAGKDEMEPEKYPIDNYIANLVFTDTIYAWAHHLDYGNGNVRSLPSAANTNNNNPDALNEQMEHFSGHYNHKPIFVTEYRHARAMTTNTTSTEMETSLLLQKDAEWDRLWHLAKVMHNALTIESASAFFYKDLYGSATKESSSSSGDDDSMITSPLAVLPNDDIFELSPEYYAFKHYSAFIDKESVRLRTNNPDKHDGVFLSVYSNVNEDKLTVVILNQNVKEVVLPIDFDSVSVTGGEVYRSTKIGDRCQKVVSDFDPVDDEMELTLEGESVTTLYLDFVSGRGVEYGQRDKEGGW